MKKIKFAMSFCSMALLLLVSGCAKPMFLQQMYYIDYYSGGLNGKVFITESPSVSFDYEPLGSIVVSEESGYVSKNKDTFKVYKLKGDDVYAGNLPWSKEEQEAANLSNIYRGADYESALQAASTKAIEMGGDAIIGLNIKSWGYRTQLNGNKHKDVAMLIIVSGMVVKRK